MPCCRVSLQHKARLSGIGVPTSCWCSAAGESNQELAFWQQQHVTDSSLVSSVYLDGPELLSYNTR